MYKLIEKSIDLGNGRSITIETGKLAKQADGAVVVKMGRTMLLATVVAARDAKEDVDFMPLSVEYKEKYAAMGRFPGGFLKREARPNDNEILVSRLVDRVLRPLFPDDYHAEVFVTVNLISADKDTLPDALAGLAASAALAVSDIPFHGPISEVRVARVNGEFIVNPTLGEVGKADLDIVVGATYENIMMVEGEMKDVAEEVMLTKQLKFSAWLRTSLLKWLARPKRESTATSRMTRYCVRKSGMRHTVSVMHLPQPVRTKRPVQRVSKI
jgi:polyribonucleotide nucleotidyltransferase